MNESKFNLYPCKVNLKKLHSLPDSKQVKPLYGQKMNDLRTVINNNKIFAKPMPKSVAKNKALLSKQKNSTSLDVNQSVPIEVKKQPSDVSNGSSLCNDLLTEEELLVEDGDSNSLITEGVNEDQLISEDFDAQVDFETMSITIDEDQDYCEFQDSTNKSENPLKSPTSESVTEKVKGWQSCAKIPKRSDTKTKLGLNSDHKKMLQPQKSESWTEFSLPLVTPSNNHFNNNTMFPSHRVSSLEYKNRHGNIMTKTAERKPVRSYFRKDGRNEPYKPIKNALRTDSHDPPKGNCYEFWFKGHCRKPNCYFKHVERIHDKKDNTDESGSFNKGLKQGFFNGMVQNEDMSMPPPQIFSPTLNKTTNQSPGQWMEYPFSEFTDKLNQLEFNKDWNIARRFSTITDVAGKEMTPIEREKFKNGLETTLIRISLAEKTKVNAKFASDVLQVKRAHGTLVWMDFFYVSMIQAEAGNYNSAVQLLRNFSMYVDSTKPDHLVVKAKWDEAFIGCLDQAGTVFDCWEDYKSLVLRSDTAMTGLLLTVDFNVLKLKLKTEDLSHCQKKMVDNTMCLSESSRSVFLRLYSPSASFQNLCDLLKPWPDLSIVPASACTRLFGSIESLDDVQTLTTILNRVPADVAGAVSANWNQFIVDCSKRGGHWSEITEQIYDIMREKGIIPTVQAAFHLLNSLCRTSNCDGLVDRYNEFNKIGLLKINTETPDWLAQSLEVFLESKSVKHETAGYSILLLLLNSTRPSQEKTIITVLDSLISNRKFPELLNLTKQCFASNTILSEKDLRRVIFHLEEWTAKPDASIEIYALTRRQYPRTGDRYCLCENQTKPQSNRSTSSSQDEQQDTKFEETFVPVSSPISAEKRLCQLAGELTIACSDSSENLIQLKYSEVIQLQGANHKSVVNGCFLGLSMANEPNYNFTTFIDTLTQLFLSKENYSSEHNSIAIAIGQIGLRLIKYTYNRSKFQEAFLILNTLHLNEISYLQCGQPFGSQIETSTPMSFCEISILCCLVCIKCASFESGLNVFRYSSYGVSAHTAFTEDEKCERDDIAHTLIEGLLRDKMQKNAWLMFMEINNDVSTCMSTERKEKIANEICTQCYLHDSEIAKEVHDFLKASQFAESVETNRALLDYFVRNNRMDEAEEMFEKGLNNDTYKQTFAYTNPFLMEVKNGLHAGELCVLIRDYLQKLCSHPYFNGHPGENPLMDTPLRLVVVPHEEEEYAEFSNNTQYFERIKTVLSQFQPQLEVNDLIHETMEVSANSIRRWYQSQQRFLSASSACSIESPPQKKRMVAIPSTDSTTEDGKSNMKMTICPTPQHDSFTDLRNFMDSQQPNYVRKCIHREICKNATKLMNENWFERKDFGEIARKMYLEFVASMKSRGNLEFNMDVKLKVGEHAESFVRKLSET